MPVEFEQSSIREWLLDTQEKSTIRDTAEHGCSGGTIGELIYYADTNAFYEKYKEEIVSLYGKNVFDQMLRIEMLQKKMLLLRKDIKATAEELKELETELHKIKVISFAGL